MCASLLGWYSVGCSESAAHGYFFFFDFELTMTPFVDRISQRIGNGPGCVGNKGINHPGVVLCGFKENARPTGAARFEIDHHANICGPRMFGNKGFRA